jgi:hypothetical protein
VLSGALRVHNDALDTKRSELLTKIALTTAPSTQVEDEGLPWRWQKTWRQWWS